jgi:hypothetical protein
VTSTQKTLVRGIREQKCSEVKPLRCAANETSVTSSEASIEDAMKKNVRGMEKQKPTSLKNAAFQYYFVICAKLDTILPVISAPVKPLRTTFHSNLLAYGF